MLGKVLCKTEKVVVVVVVVHVVVVVVVVVVLKLLILQLVYMIATWESNTLDTFFKFCLN